MESIHTYCSGALGEPVSIQFHDLAAKEENPESKREAPEKRGITFASPKPSEARRKEIPRTTGDPSWRGTSARSSEKPRPHSLSPTRRKGGSRRMEFGLKIKR